MDRMLSKGMTGQDVRSLQDVLNYQIRRGDPLVVDGIFGPKTDARLREFQRSNSLVADGIAGPRTNAMLFEMGDTVMGPDDALGREEMHASIRDDPGNGRPVTILAA